MRAKKEIVTITCDVCGKIKPDEEICKGVTEAHKDVVHGMMIAQWYGQGKRIEDICIRCNNALVTFLQGLRSQP